MRNILNFIAKVSISIALLIFLFHRIDLHKTIFYIRTIEPSYFIYGILLFICLIFLGIVRWHVLLEILKKDLSFGRIFASYCGGLFFNLFLPSSIGGDIVRTADLSLHTKDSSSIFATVFLDRIFGFLGLVLIAFLGFLFCHLSGLKYDFRLFLSMIVFTIILICIFLMLFSKRVFDLVNKIMFFKIFKKYFREFHNCCYSFRFQRITLIKTTFLSVLIQGLHSVIFYFVGMSLGIKLNIIYYFIFIPVINTITILPISIGGLGLRDNAAVVLFSALGVAPDKIAAMTLINFAFLFFVGTIGGIVYGAAIYSRRL